MATLTAEQLADHKKPENVRVSPDGKHVVYVLQQRWAQEPPVTSSLWLAETSNSVDTRQITSGHYNDIQPEFSPDGQYISFISNRARNESPAVIYLLPVGFGEAHSLTSEDNEECILLQKWSPDGLHIAFVSSDEKTTNGKAQEKDGRLVKMLNDQKSSRLRIVNVKSKDVTTLVSQEHTVTAFAWSPDSKSLAYITASPELDESMIENGISVVSLQDGPAMLVCQPGTRVDSIAWYGEELLFTAPQSGTSVHTSSSALWSVAEDGSKLRNVRQYPDRCLPLVRTCKELAILHHQYGLSDYLELYPSRDQAFNTTFDLESGWDAVSTDQGIIVVYVQNSHNSSNVFANIDGKPRQISRHENLPEESDWHSIQFANSDGTPVDGLVYTPRSPNGSAVALVHGGPYMRSTAGSSDLLDFLPWLLSLGYTILYPNYRGGCGHGAEYAEAVQGNPAVGYEDLIAFIEVCIERGFASKEKVAIAGWSYGGYLTYVAVTRDARFHFKAAIAGAGITDWDSMCTTDTMPNFCAQLIGQAPWNSTAEDTSGRRGSPLWHMDDINTPLLIVHGEKDERVPVNQALGFHRGLRARGKICESLIYADEGHAVPVPFKRVNYIHMMNSIRDFLEKHMAP